VDLVGSRQFFGSSRHCAVPGANWPANFRQTNEVRITIISFASKKKQVGLPALTLACAGTRRFGTCLAANQSTETNAIPALILTEPQSLWN
jgi:hypothetical protein